MLRLRSLLLLISLRFTQFLGEIRQMGSQTIEFFSLSILLGLISHLFFNLFQLLGLFSKLQLFFAVKLLFKSDHILLYILELLFVVISLLDGIINFGLGFDKFDGLLSKFISKDT